MQLVYEEAPQRDVKASPFVCQRTLKQLELDFETA